MEYDVEIMDKLSDKLFCQMCEAYARTPEASVMERKYLPAKVALENIPDNLKAELDDVESMHLRAAKLKCEYACKCGLYAAFRFHFSRYLAPDYFETTMDQFKTTDEYGRISADLIKQVEYLSNSLGDEGHHIEDIDSIWDARNHGIAYQAYQYGFHWGTDICSVEQC